MSRTKHLAGLSKEGWKKHFKSPSRTCWNTGQPYNGLGCFLAYRQEKIAQRKRNQK